MSTKIRTLSQLPPITENAAGENSLIEISQRLSIGDKAHYISKKMRLYDFGIYIYKAVEKELETRHGLIINNTFEPENIIDPDSLIAKTNFKYIANALYNLYKGKPELDSQITFNKRPRIAESLSKNLSELNNKDNVVDVKLLKGFSDQNNLQLPGMEFDFSTYFFNPEVETHSLSATNLVSIDENRTPNIRVGTLMRKGNAANNYSFGLNEIDIKENHYNEWIFRIPNNSRQSNNWVAPASGMFTCFGWLDEKDSSYANNSLRWVALEAYNKDKDKWYILQLQPFSPNEFCSYVGFTFPVKAGIELRIRTGFTVGTNSDKYFSIIGSLTNHIANAFIGGVYTSDAANQYIPKEAGTFNYFEGIPSDWGRYWPTNRTVYDLVCDLSASLSGAFAGPYIDLINKDSYKRSHHDKTVLRHDNWSLNDSNKSLVMLDSRNALSALISLALKNTSDSNRCAYGTLNKSKDGIKSLYFYRVAKTGTVNIDVTGDTSAKGTTLTKTYIAYASPVNDGITYSLKELDQEVETIRSGVDSKENISLPLKAGNLIVFQTLSADNAKADVSKMPEVNDENYRYISPTSDLGTSHAFIASINEMYNLTPNQQDEYDFYAELPDIEPVIPTPGGDPIDIPDWSGDINELYLMIRNLTLSVHNNYNTLSNSIITNVNNLNTTITNNYNTLNANKVGYYNGTVLADWPICTMNKSANGHDSMTLDADGNMPYANDNKVTGGYTHCRRIDGTYYYFKPPVSGTYQITLCPENGDKSGTIANPKCYGVVRCWLNSVVNKKWWMRTRGKSGNSWGSWGNWSTDGNRNYWSLLAQYDETISGTDESKTIVLNLKAGVPLIFTLFNVSATFSGKALDLGGFEKVLGYYNPKDFYRVNRYTTHQVEYYTTDMNNQNATAHETATGLNDSSKVTITSTTHRKNNKVQNIKFADVQLLAKN